MHRALLPVTLVALVAACGDNAPTGDLFSVTAVARGQVTDAAQHAVVGAKIESTTQRATDIGMPHTKAFATTDAAGQFALQVGAVNIADGPATVSLTITPPAGSGLQARDTNGIQVTLRRGEPPPDTVDVVLVLERGASFSYQASIDSGAFHPVAGDSAMWFYTTQGPFGPAIQVELVAAQADAQLLPPLRLDLYGNSTNLARPVPAVGTYPLTSQDPDVIYIYTARDQAMSRSGALQITAADSIWLDATFDMDMYRSSPFANGSIQAHGDFRARRVPPPPGF